MPANMFIRLFVLFTCLTVTKGLLSSRHQMINTDYDDIASSIIEFMIEERRHGVCMYVHNYDLCYGAHREFFGCSKRVNKEIGLLLTWQSYLLRTVHFS